MTHESDPQESSSNPLHIRSDVVRALRDRPFATFENVYDQLKEADAEEVIRLLGDALRYSHRINEQQAFAAGILHVLGVQLASHEVERLEAVLKHSHPNDDDDGEDQPRSSEPDDGQPVA